MNESYELLESFCTGHACVRAERGGDGSVATGVRPHTKRSKIVDRVPVHVGTWYAFTAM